MVCRLVASGNPASARSAAGHPDRTNSTQSSAVSRTSTHQTYGSQAGDATADASTPIRTLTRVATKLMRMQIPFADAVLSRLNRRKAGLELIEEIEDEALEPVEAADLLSAEPALLLQRMENRLIRHQLSAPEVLSPEELRKLRYILNFARLADFEPGAAGPGGTRGRGDVSVGGEIAPWRSRVTDALYRPLREEPDPITALKAAREVLAGLVAGQDGRRPGAGGRPRE